ncbi:uncharacterized protein EV422DRAFT_305965 [Fimicolochytrium jonesii]|uniref:uncharacterized protein n=1 Tax=Fimicolochytrium jonesii TaxID=1396493 RepID=UPI0022FDD377|nr:uncharacterized protein EV422DRAFT_305965 [Fimicolochytrium jonesii]KAI8824083.1 hypothetical protein EV422DRAFT_305965 [Fimicolochytrium jonesii]
MIALKSIGMYHIALKMNTDLFHRWGWSYCTSCPLNALLSSICTLALALALDFLLFKSASDSSPIGLSLAFVVTVHGTYRLRDLLHSSLPSFPNSHGVGFSSGLHLPWQTRIEKRAHSRVQFVRCLPSRGRTRAEIHCIIHYVALLKSGLSPAQIRV